MCAPGRKRFLPVTEWPELDRAAWASAHASGDYFTSGGLAARWSPSTDNRCEQEYGRLLLFLQDVGNLRDLRRVGERVTQEEDLRPFIDMLRARIAPLSVVAALRHISQAVRAMDPGSDRSLINRVAGNLSRRARPVRRIEDRLLSSRELLKVGMDMMDEAENSHGRDKPRAVLYRDGLLIAFLTLCPLRRKNVQALRNEHHLDLESGSDRLSIPAKEMKTRGRDFEVTLPEELVERISRYWTYYRPILAWRPGTDDTALWLTTRGTVMTAATLADRIKRIVWERKRLQFSPHLFRHSAATFVAEVAPQQALIAVGVLGHTQFRTTRRHYVRGQQLNAVRMFQNEISAIMQRGQSAAGFED